MLLVSKYTHGKAAMRIVEITSENLNDYINLVCKTVCSVWENWHQFR